ncbi:MAG: GreA/GreB family elongation factor [Patescibacteria group bacterium]|jgi:transcription elongation factor GreA
MRLPNRKPGKYTFLAVDTTMTPEKLAALKEKLDRLKKVTRPQAMKDTRQYGENGDFSENAEYQIAKGRLRGLNRQIDELEYQINHAVIIATPKDADTVQIGHQVTLQTHTGAVTYQILGSSESNPTAGIISYQSPLGAALIGHKTGEIVKINNKEYTISLIK